MSSRALSEPGVIAAFAEPICKRLCRRVITDLRRIDNALLSGDDSGLRNAWEEICVQIQDEYSIFWDAYDQTTTDLVARHVHGLARHELEALWLQTDAGESWVYDEPDERELHPVSVDDVIGYLKDVVYLIAADWNNRRIEAYLARY
jgi:hypothetical protein